MTERESKISSLLGDLLDAAQELIECQDEEDIGEIPISELAGLLYEKTVGGSHGDAIQLIKDLMTTYESYEKDMQSLLDAYDNS